MNKFFKAAVIFAVTALILAAPVFAQSELESNTSKATAGVFTSDIDDSMSVLDYSGVEFDDWFGFIGYGGASGPVQLGFAKRFGALYLGTYYSGNVLSSGEYRTERVTTTYDLAKQLKTQTGTTITYGSNIYGGDQISSDNEIGVLIGVANMGFLIGFAEEVEERLFPQRSITTTEYLDGRVEHSQGDIVDWSYIDGKLTPSLTWGMNLELGAVTIKPKISAGIDIVLDSQLNNYKAVPYTTVGGELIGAETINYNGQEGGYIRPDFEVGLGIDFENFSIDFSYGMGFDVYSDNSYDGSGFSGSTVGTVNWTGSTETTSSLATTTTNKSTYLEITEPTDSKHNIHFGFYKASDIAEGLKLGLYAGADVSIGASTSDSYTLQLERSETKYNNAALSSGDYSSEREFRSYTTSTSTSEFSIVPFVNIGAQYTLIPGRFTINAGIGINPLGEDGYTSTVRRTSYLNGNGVERTKTYDSKGVVVSESVDVYGGDETTDYMNVSNTWGYLSAGLFGGFVFNFTENFALDTYFGTSTGTDFTLDVTTLSVLLSFKF